MHSKFQIAVLVTLMGISLTLPNQALSDTTIICNAATVTRMLEAADDYGKTYEINESYQVTLSSSGIIKSYSVGLCDKNIGTSTDENAISIWCEWTPASRVYSLIINRYTTQFTLMEEQHDEKLWFTEGTCQPQQKQF